WLASPVSQRARQADWRGKPRPTDTPISARFCLAFTPMRQGTLWNDDLPLFDCSDHLHVDGIGGHVYTLVTVGL
ncbi:MAG: hypothetical protein ABI324_10065, partial [Ktedonobacteraceae bacterium]